MGMTAYLELYRSTDFDPAHGSTLLFTIKNHLPFGWFLFFDAGDFRSLKSKRDGSTYTVLQKDKAAAVARARQRLATLGPVFDEELGPVLHAFVRSVEASRGSVLVLNSHRFESSREDLVAPLEFVDSLTTATPDDACEEGAELFDLGVTFSTEEGKLVVFLDEKGGVTGWPEAAAEIAWFEQSVVTEPTSVSPAAGGALGRFVRGLTSRFGRKEAPVATVTPAPSPTRAEEAIARVWAAPDSKEARRVCADELLTLGDPRGEIFAMLGSDVELSERAERKLSRLVEEHRALLEGPFVGMRTMLEGGFPSRVTLPRVPTRALLEHPAWATVHTIHLSGESEVLLHPNLARVRRVLLRSADVGALARAGKPLPFRSVALVDEHTPEAFLSLASRTVFPELVEVWVKSFGVWLPPAAERLLETRPEVAVRGASYEPHDDPRALMPLTEEQQAQRRARWNAPAQGAQLAGKRFDNA